MTVRVSRRGRLATVVAVVALFAAAGQVVPARGAESRPERPAPSTPPVARVDLAEGVVACTGRAAPTLQEEFDNAAVTRGRTYRAARERARRACLDALRAASLPGSDSVGALIDRDQRLAAAVAEAIRRARPAAPPRFYSDGGVEADLVARLPPELTRPAPAATPDQAPVTPGAAPDAAPRVR